MRDVSYCGWTVDDLVPHRGDMSWLSRVLHVDADTVAAEAEIHEGMFFLREGRLGVWCGIEFMAQAVAAWAGHRARTEGREVLIGMLVGTRLFTPHCPYFSVGQTLRIDSRCELLAQNGLGMFDCSITVDGIVAATARLSVFEPPDAATFLEIQRGQS